MLSKSMQGRICRECVFCDELVYFLYMRKRWSSPCRLLDRPWCSHVVEVPIFHDIRHTKLVRLSALLTGRLYPQEIFLELISVDCRSIVGPGVLRQWKIPVIPSEIQHATLLLVVRCLNQLQHHVPPLKIRWKVKQNE